MPPIVLRRKRAGNPEHDLQVSIFSWWKRCVSEPAHGYLFAVPNGGKRAGMKGGKVANADAPPAWWLIAEGLRAGVSDLILLRPGGRVVCIEVKTDDSLLTTKTYQTPDQKTFEENCKALAVPYRVCRSLEQFADILDEFNIPYLSRPFTPALLRAKASGRGKAAGRPPSAAPPASGSADPAAAAPGTAASSATRRPPARPAKGRKASPAPGSRPD